MQNFDLLKAVGKTRKPVLLKRGLSATIEEWLMSAEYIMAEATITSSSANGASGNFETYTRNTLDLSAVLAVKRQSHLPIVVDPSHATGKRWMVADLAKAAVAAGADGLTLKSTTTRIKLGAMGHSRLRRLCQPRIRSANWLLSSVGKYKGYRGGDYHG